MPLINRMFPGAPRTPGRIRRYAKVDAPRRIVVGIGTVGVLSFDALRWCVNVGVTRLGACR